MSVHQLTPLPVAILLLTAAAIAMTSFAPRRVHDVLATAGAAAAAVICALLLDHARHAPIVEWLGGWRPQHRVALGISLVVDQLGAGGALLAAVMLTATLVYSWSYFDELDGLVHALMLVLTAGIVGICLTGDLFNMIVFFVMTTVAAIGLTAVENEYRGPLQGAINFAVVNSIAGFALLMGAALLYGRTGALNLAQIAAAVAQHRTDALVAVALVMLVLGFLTKAGIAPFHFWLPDAQAVAPTPASALMSSAMVAGMFVAVARILSTVFALPLGHHAAGVRAVLVGVGAFTALLGAVSCFEQRHLKRMLAFATVSQAGVILCGVGMLRDEALAGAALSALGFGFAIAALFGAVGVLVRRYGSMDEFDLAGRGRHLPMSGAVFAFGAVALAALPPAAGFYGRWLIADAARAAGYGWLPPLLALSSAIAAAAILRVGARVFLGWGAAGRDDARPAAAERARESAAVEDGATASRRSAVLAVVPLLLAATALAAGPIPGFPASVESAAAHFRDVHSYLGVVLDGKPPHYVTAATHPLGTAAWLYALGSLALALALARTGLRGRRAFPRRVTGALHAAHSGLVGDYVTWWTFGMATLGGLVLWAVAG